MLPGRLFVVIVAAFALLPEGAAVAEAVDQVPLLIVVYAVGGAIITEIPGTSPKNFTVFSSFIKTHSFCKIKKRTTEAARRKTYSSISCHTKLFNNVSHIKKEHTFLPVPKYTRQYIFSC